MLERIHHLAYLVEDLEIAVQFYEQAFGAKTLRRFQYKIVDQNLDCQCAMLDVGATRLELMQPIQEGKKPLQGMQLAHVAYEVADVDAAALSELALHGVKPMPGYPRQSGAGGRTALLVDDNTLGARDQLMGP